MNNSSLDNNNLSEDENYIPGPKKRGRKKKIIETPVNENNEEPTSEMIETLQIEQVKKKRGRKKKWEVETTTKIIQDTPITFSENTNKNITKEIDDNYESENILFGNLNIKVHTNKEPVQINDIKETLINNDKKFIPCKINLSNSDLEDSDEDYDENENGVKDDTKAKVGIANNSNSNGNGTLKNKNKNSNKSNNLCNFNKKKIEKNFKVMKYHTDEFYAGKEIIMSTFRCYHCHHNFNNKPFFLPTDYNSEIQRFKVTGNFCSPNCVKSYAFNSKLHSSKIYLVGHMYRTLFGANYTIKPAPPIQCLKEYGGFMTIEQYRASFENDKEYCLKNVCSRVVMDEIIDK